MALIRNPLDPIVDELVKNSNYLTAEHIKQLAPLLEGAESPVPKTPSLKSSLERQLRLLQKLEHLGTSSTDIGELKRVMDAARDLYNLIAKYATAVAAEERTNAIFESICQTFEALDDKSVSERFLALYKQKIAEIDRKNGELE